MMLTICNNHSHLSKQAQQVTPRSIKKDLEKKPEEGEDEEFLKPLVTSAEAMSGE